MELVPAPPVRRPVHPLLEAMPTATRETLAWFPGPNGHLVERRRGACRLLDPLTGASLPCPAPPPGAAPLARFEGRRWVLGAGVAWIEGRLLTSTRGRRIARLLVEEPALAAALAMDLPLLPATAPLAEEALAQAESRLPRVPAGAPELRADATAEAALAAATRHLLAILLAESARVSPDDLRGVHQSRVALRRLRSLVRMFRPAEPDWAAWNRRLGEMARAFGAARDWDVFTRGIAAGTLAALGGDVRLKRLVRAAETERRAAYAGLAAELAGPGFRAVIFEGLRLAALPPAGETPLAPLAARLLRKRWKRLKQAGAVIEDLPAEALHEMRLDAKRLRYAAEPFAALWPGKRGRRFLRRLSALQDALGLANDAEVAKALAARLAGRGAGGFAIGTVTGFAAGRAEGSRMAAIAAWRELARTPRFWDRAADS